MTKWPTRLTRVAHIYIVYRISSVPMDMDHQDINHRPPNAANRNAMATTYLLRVLLPYGIEYRKQRAARPGGR